MTDTPKTSRWNSLLETLGLPTPTPPAPPAAETPAPRVSSPPPVREKPAPKPKVPPKPSRNWSAIAGDLGLEVPPEPAPPAAPPAPPVAPAPPPARQHAIEPPPRPRPVEEPPAFGAPPAGRTPLDDIFGEKAGDVDVFELSSGREQRRPYSPPPPAPPARLGEEEEEDGPILDYDLDSEADLLLDEEPAAGVPEREPSEEPAREPRGGRGPRDEDRGGDREGGRRRRRRRGRGRGGRRDEGPVEAGGRASGPPPVRRGEFDEQDDDLLPAPEELDDVFADLDEVDEDLPPRSVQTQTGGEREPAGDRHEGRGRGRRGRGRGRGREERSGEGRGEGRPRHERGGQERVGRERPARSGDVREGRAPERMPPRDARLEPVEDVLDIIEDDELEFPVPPTIARPDAGGRAETGTRQDIGRPSAAFEEGLSEDEDAEHEGELGHGAHKKIPTWQDAVAIMIDANMAARASGSDRGHRGRRGGGRGR